MSLVVPPISTTIASSRPDKNAAPRIGIGRARSECQNGKRLGTVRGHQGAVILREIERAGKSEILQGRLECPHRFARNRLQAGIEDRCVLTLKQAEPADLVGQRNGGVRQRFGDDRAGGGFLLRIDQCEDARDSHGTNVLFGNLPTTIPDCFRIEVADRGPVIFEAARQHCRHTVDFPAQVPTASRSSAAAMWWRGRTGGLPRSWRDRDAAQGHSGKCVVPIMTASTAPGSTLPSSKALSTAFTMPSVTSSVVGRLAVATTVFPVKNSRIRVGATDINAYSHVFLLLDLFDGDRFSPPSCASIRARNSVAARRRNPWVFSTARCVVTFTL